MRFKAALFDMDGTLLDTLAGIADSMNAMLAGSGYPQHPLQAYKYFVGNGMEILVERAFPAAARTEQRIAQGVAAMRADYRTRWRRTTTVYQGIPDLLTALDRAGLKLAVLSNKSDDFTREMAQELLSAWPFEVVLGARPEVPKKPDPSTAIEIAERMQVVPRDFLYLGDTAVDMTTAIGAGMHPIGALWGFRGAAELLEAGARMLIAQPTDLIAWLQ